MTDRVVVFLDYQNVYRGARRTYHTEYDPHWHGQIDPVKLAQHLAADSPYPRRLEQVRIYRGQPDSTKDPRGYGASRRQHATWEASPLVASSRGPSGIPGKQEKSRRRRALTWRWLWTS